MLLEDEMTIFDLPIQDLEFVQFHPGLENSAKRLEVCLLDFHVIEHEMTIVGLPNQDLEFVQFHPTGIYGAGCLITLVPSHWNIWLITLVPSHWNIWRRMLDTLVLFHWNIIIKIIHVVTSSPDDP
jgi:hypothetical protein